MDLHNADESVWAFARRAVGEDAGSPITCVFNATPVPRDGYRVGVAEAGTYRKLFDSDDVIYGGSGYNRQEEAGAALEGAQGYPLSLRLDLPPLGAVFFIGPPVQPVKIIQAGLPRPLGATWTKHGVNFALFSSHATRVEVCLFDAHGGAEIGALRFAGAHRRYLAWPAAAAARGPGKPLRLLRARTGRAARRAALRSQRRTDRSLCPRALDGCAAALAGDRRRLRLGRRSAARRLRGAIRSSTNCT